MTNVRLRSESTKKIIFKPHPQSERRKRSAIILIKYLLRQKNPDVLAVHRRELLSILLWKITLAESSKCKARLRTQRAMSSSKKSKLEHDHVFQRARMIAILEKAALQEVDCILKNAVGCVVTKEEHARLSHFDKRYDSWDRYRKARLTVIDTQTGERVV